MTPTQHLALLSVVRDVIAERHRQHAVHGEQTLPWHAYYFGHGQFTEAEELARRAQRDGNHGWLDVITEEFCEVTRANTPEERRAELVQLAALCMQAVDALDRSQAKQEAA